MSFTNNSFKGCNFRHYGNGCPLYLEGCVGWEFDKACHYLAFAGANVRIRSGASIRVVNLALLGLFETTQGDGVEYAVEFLVPAGETTAIQNSEINLGSPHAKTAYLKIIDPGGGTAGTLKLQHCEIRFMDQVYGVGTGPLFSSNGDTQMSGWLYARTSAVINLNELSAFYGFIFVPDLTAATSLTPSSTHAFIVMDESHRSKFVGGRWNMASLPTSSAGLSTGDLWNDSGTLKIA